MKQVAREVYRYGTWVLLVLVIGQFVFAGMGVFSLLGPNADAKGTSFLMIHAGVGPLVIFVLCLVMVACGFVGSMPRRLTGLPGILIGLIIVQSLLLIPYHAAQGNAAASPIRFISGLHVVNALLIFWLAIQLPFWARHDLESPLEVPRAAPA